MYEYRLESIKSIYDGDTMIIILDCGFGVSKIEKIRLAHIDAPELRGEERELGLISRDWLRTRMALAIEENRNITIKTFKDKKGKWGRYIAEIFIDGISVNMEMIEKGYATLYM